jgi:carboxypeptidase C (cathepsin A)
MFFSSLVAGLALSSLALASPIASDSAPKDKRSFVERDGTNYTVFEHAATGAKMEFVTNSGICETTKGVNQYSGYLSVGTNMNMWFWFFEARSNPTTAPLATWFNGGPGCSSMIGLFQENGPCSFVNGASTPSLNPYSWNNYANMLYIDQPIGVGFSYGSDPVDSTATAAPYVWKLIQAFYAQFPQYENRDFGVFTESYGGHYGPEFADYFEQQNAAITAGTVKGQNMKLVALGINNGWFDATLQEKVTNPHNSPIPHTTN